MKEHKKTMLLWNDGGKERQEDDLTSEKKMQMQGSLLVCSTCKKNKQICSKTANAGQSSCLQMQGSVTEQWQKRKTRRLPYICIKQQMQGSLIICRCRAVFLYFFSAMPSFCSRVVFLCSFISALFLFFFSGPSLLEMKFCRNYLSLVATVFPIQTQWETIVHPC